MKKVKLALLSTVCVISFGANASSSCDILEKGNKNYSKGHFEKALKTYKTIENIDIYGKGNCTMSIYATIATIYTKLGDRSLKEYKITEAIRFFKLSSKYNRAFAYAVDCNLRSCENSRKFWSN